MPDLLDLPTSANSPAALVGCVQSSSCDRSLEAAVVGLLAIWPHCLELKMKKMLAHLLGLMFAATTVTMIACGGGADDDDSAAGDDDDSAA